jgi:hypothetical protein
VYLVRYVDFSRVVSFTWWKSYKAAPTVERFSYQRDIALLGRPVLARSACPTPGSVLDFGAEQGWMRRRASAAGVRLPAQPKSVSLPGKYGYPARDGGKPSHRFAYSTV